MPKKIITEQTLPVALGLLHGWQGKLTWDLYAEKLSKRLKVRIAKRSLYKHDEIVAVYQQVQDRLKQEAPAESVTPATLAALRQELEKTRSELAHQTQKVTNLQHALVRLQRNAYLVPGLDAKKLKDLLTNPLPDETKN